MVLNQMTLAFINAKVKKITPLVSQVVACLERHLKARKAPKEWAANLSYKTYRKLVSQGVPLQG